MTFVETSVSQDIFRTIDIARELGKNCAIVGRPGVGKSRALVAYREKTQGVIGMTATAVSGNALRDLLGEVAERLGLYVTGSIANVQRQMHRYDLTGTALIIDEAQNLKLQAFRELLHLHDFSNLCLIFCGNEEVLKRVNTDKGAFAQISRRVPIRAEFNLIMDEDTDRLANAFGVEGMDAYRMLRIVARTYHTDGVVTVLELGRRIAGTKTIKADHVRQACQQFPHYGALLK